MTTAAGVFLCSCGDNRSYAILINAVAWMNWFRGSARTQETKRVKFEAKNAALASQILAVLGPVKAELDLAIRNSNCVDAYKKGSAELTQGRIDAFLEEAMRSQSDKSEMSINMKDATQVKKDAANMVRTSRRVPRKLFIVGSAATTAAFIVFHCLSCTIGPCARIL